MSDYIKLVDLVSMVVVMVGVNDDNSDNSELLMEDLTHIYIPCFHSLNSPSSLSSSPCFLTNQVVNFVIKITN